jgi:hypothetical protein
MSGPYQLVVSSFGTKLLASKTYALTVSGIKNPTTYSTTTPGSTQQGTTGNFTVQMVPNKATNDSMITGVIVAGKILVDPKNIATIQTIEASSYICAVTSSLNISITINSMTTPVQKTDLVVVRFPSAYNIYSGSLQTLIGPCTITNFTAPPASAGTPISGKTTCSFFGNAVRVVMPYGLIVNQQYNISIANVQNPLYGGVSGDFQLYFVDSTIQQLKIRNYGIYDSYQNLIFTQTLDAIDVFDDGKPAVSVVVPPGGTAFVLVLKAHSSPSFKSNVGFSFSSAQSTFQILPTTANVSIGDASKTIYIRCPAGTTAGSDSLSIIKYERGIPVYLPIAAIPVSISDDQIFIQVYNTLSVVLGTTSVMQNISLTFAPYAGLTITIQQSAGVNILPSNVLYFNYTDTIQYFWVQVLNNATANTTVNLTITPNDTTSFAISATTLQVYCLPKPSTAPNIQLALGTPTATSVPVIITTNIDCVLLYQAIKIPNMPQNFSTIYTLVTSGKTQVVNTTAVSVSGILEISQNAKQQIINIVSMIPNNNYNLIIYLAFKNLTMISNTSFSITTPPNQNPMLLSLGSASTPGANEVNTILCVIAQASGANPSLVSTETGLQCNMTLFTQQQGNSSRRMLGGSETSAVQQANDLRSQSNPTYILIQTLSNTLQTQYGVNANLLKNMDVTTLQEFYNNLVGSSQQSSSTFNGNLNVYVNPDPTNPAFNITNLNALISNQQQFSYAFSQYSTGQIPPILKQAGQVSTFGAGGTTLLVPALAQPPTLFKGGSSFTLSVSLTSAGIVYAVALNLTQPAPNPLQISLGFDGLSNSSVANASNTSSYDSSGNLRPVRVKLTGLSPQLRYNIYYVMAYNNPVAPVLSTTVNFLTDSPAITGLLTNATETMSSPVLAAGGFLTIILALLHLFIFV